jgi:glycosyltransferase involved in cell wall biosynthesis
LTRVLVVSGEPVGGTMAGPAIRALELARVLARHCEVTLAAPPPSMVDDHRLRWLPAGREDFDVLLGAVRRHDVVVAQQLPPQLLRAVAKLPVRYVADLYNPLVIELLEGMADAGVPHEQSVFRRLRRMVFAQCALADFIICASEKQRDLWIGGLGLCGLIDLETYRRDRTYRAVVDVVPFGLSDRPAVHERPVLKGVWPGIGATDQVLLWGGGIWRWLDALTPIRAVERLASQGRRDVHLFFPAVQRPAEEEQVAPSGAEAAITYARERGLDGVFVHFNDGWIPYEERQNYLLEADLGVSAHGEHLETRFSFRNRILDYLWAGLPMVVTEGDVMADLVQRERLGAILAAGDDEGFALACAELLDDGDRRAATAARVRQVAQTFRWDVAARPLVDFCLGVGERPARRPNGVTIARAIYAQYPAVLADALRQTGPRGVARRLSRQLGRVTHHRA